MADTRISDLNSAGALTGTELIPIARGANNFRTTPNSILAIVSGDVSIAAGGAATVTISASDLIDATTAGAAMITAANAGAQTALLSSFVGDNGAGGTKGLVPAPSAGDAALGRYLNANGAWTTPTGGTDLGVSRNSTTVTISSSTGDSAVIPVATASLAGLLSAEDKDALDQIIAIVLEGGWSGGGGGTGTIDSIVVTPGVSSMSMQFVGDGATSTVVTPSPTGIAVQVVGDGAASATVTPGVSSISFRID